MSDCARERYRLDKIPTLPPRFDSPGAAVMVGQVVSAAAKIEVGKFLLVNPVSVFGAEVEGGPWTASAGGAASVPVYLIGPGLPQTGDLLICRFVDFRWVADRGLPHDNGNKLAGCPCAAIPSTIYMHVKSQPTNGAESFAFPCTFTWQTKPSVLATYRSDATGYYSTATQYSSDRFFKYYYWFGCYQGSYFVNGLYTPDSPLGYPGQFQIMTWLAGLPGNNCSPFTMTNGSTSNTFYKSQGITVDSVGPA